MNTPPDHPTLDAARFPGDVRGHEILIRDPQLSLKIAAAKRMSSRCSLRRRYLAHAVHIRANLLPELAHSFDDVHDRMGISDPLEAYVYCDGEINASVIRGARRTFVVLSSGAVERLSQPELDFIIGHEIGHACFGHLEMPVNELLSQRGQLTAREAMQVLAWQRAAEISADRAGLLCCGSLDVAANALFKSLTGLAMNGMSVDPRQFAEQWHDLAREVAQEACADHWMATHPFPPLRMKALIEFWSSERAAAAIDRAPGGRAASEVDENVESMLAMMDPLARDRSGAADPLLKPFLLWGGLYIATADGALAEKEIENLRSVVGNDSLQSAVSAGGLTPLDCRARFLSARSSRQTPLTALELHRIFSGLASVAAADHEVTSQEIAAMHDLASACGVSPGFVDVALSRAA
jgi:uncharacterized tellurite resistance protein B-like protein